MRCIEIGEKDKKPIERSKINGNMRCIETRLPAAMLPGPPPINRNMRCIETRLPAAMLPGPPPINRNMRCIEIP